MIAALPAIERIGSSLRVLGDLAKTRRLGGYDPYPFQRLAHRRRSGKWQDGRFEDFGVVAKQALLSAGNQNGKTEFGCADTAIHATGDYPAWWDGPDFTELLRLYPLIWVGGANNDRVRDVCQAALCGNPVDPDAWGTGWIPKERLKDRVLKTGVRNGYDSITVLHKAGFLVTIAFKSYDASLLDWAGQPVALVLLDEEPPREIYSQCLARTIATQGYIFMTFTPEHGATEIITQYMTELQPGQLLMFVGWEDARHEDGRTHLAEATKTQLLRAFMPHEREMRTRGLPVFGRGLVFPLDLEQVLCDPFSIHPGMPRVGGLDFGAGGVNHPTAAAWLACDRDAKARWMYWEYKSRSTEPAVHAQGFKAQGSWIPFGWPHDGHRREAYASAGIANLYRGMGVRLLMDHASNEDGSQIIEPGFLLLYNEMLEGTFKIFRTLTETQAEFKTFHRSEKDGSIVPRNDDLLSAMRIARLSDRFAIPADRTDVPQRPEFANGVFDYDPRAA